MCIERLPVYICIETEWRGNLIFLYAYRKVVLYVQGPVVKKN